MSKPYITVIVLAYNSSRYINEALNSLLEQEILQDFKILISDDCSVDNTQKIIKDYCKKYPDKINAIYNSKNLGISGNLFKTIENVKTKYISLFAADDIITDKFYLRDSFNILEENESLAMTYTNGYGFIHPDKKNSFKYIYEPTKNKFGFTYWAKNNFFIINSHGMLVRRSALPIKFESWMHFSSQEDWLLWFLLLNNGGEVVFQRDKFSTLYRSHSKNYTNSSSLIKRYEGALVLSKNLKNITREKYKTFLNPRPQVYYEKLTYLYLYHRQFLSFSKYFFLFLFRKSSLFKKKKFLKTVIKLGILKHKPDF